MSVRPVYAEVYVDYKSTCVYVADEDKRAQWMDFYASLVNSRRLCCHVVSEAAEAGVGAQFVSYDVKRRF